VQMLRKRKENEQLRQEHERLLDDMRAKVPR
jgi:hypothetical protein